MDMGPFPRPPWFNQHPRPENTHQEEVRERVEADTAESELENELDESRDQLSPKRKDTLNISMKASKIIDDVLKRKSRPSVDEASPERQSVDVARRRDSTNLATSHAAKLLHQTCKKLRQDASAKREKMQMDWKQREKEGLRASQDAASESGLGRAKQGQMSQRFSQAGGSRNNNRPGKRAGQNFSPREARLPSVGSQKGGKGSNGKKGKGMKLEQQQRKLNDKATVPAETDGETLQPSKSKSQRLDQRLLKAIRSQLSQQTASSTAALSRDSLAKLVNSPRSRRDRYQVARMVRSHSRAAHRLTSRPRLTLHTSSDAGSGEDTSDEAYSLNLEELPAEVQDQILQLINNEMTGALGDSSDGEASRPRLPSQSDDDVMVVEDMDSAPEEVDLVGLTADLPSSAETTEDPTTPFSLVPPEEGQTLQNFLQNAINTQEAAHIPLDMLNTDIKAEICDLPDIKPEIHEDGSAPSMNPFTAQQPSATCTAETAVKLEQPDSPKPTTATGSAQVHKITPKKHQHKHRKHKTGTKHTVSKNTESQESTKPKTSDEFVPGVSDSHDRSPSPQWETEPPQGGSDTDPFLQLLDKANSQDKGDQEGTADSPKIDGKPAKRRHTSGEKGEVLAQ